MNSAALLKRFRQLSALHLSRPGAGTTAERHRAIFSAAVEDVSLAKLTEAHWDAVAILEEAGLSAASGTTYAVWASEIPDTPLTLHDGRLFGKKDFCSGAAMVDRALVTSGDVLVEIDLKAAPELLAIDETQWQTDAFRMTQTAMLTFDGYPTLAVVGRDGWYTRRTGFWQGACGPAAAWAGGAAGLYAYALKTKRADPHTRAHLGAIASNLWAMEALLHSVGEEFDRHPDRDASLRALQTRHIVEQLCTDVLHRFARALGPAPLAKNEDIARRHAELTLFLRQCHAERDLEMLGRLCAQ